VLNAVDGCMPSDLAAGTSAEIEEERRLLYVALTRARDHLHVIVPQRFFVHGQRHNGDRHMYAARTRFIPAGLLGHFESCSWQAPAAHEASVTARADRYPPAGAQELGVVRYSFSVRKRSAFTMTDTELSDIASAATTGLRRRPKLG
jgi:DNA helicase-2/ATP-dependent DNA helicase PcrA